MEKSSEKRNSDCALSDIKDDRWQPDEWKKDQEQCWAGGGVKVLGQIQ